jgi:hypothetical protein
LVWESQGKGLVREGSVNVLWQVIRDFPNLYSWKDYKNYPLPNKAVPGDPPKKELSTFAGF